MPRRLKVVATVALAGLGGLAAVASSSGASTHSSSAATGSPIDIGLITSQSGALAPQFAGVAAAFKARLAWQNSQGGVNGHKLVAVIADDQTSPTGLSSAARYLVSSRHVLIVDAESAFTGAAAAYLHSAGEPVVGGDYSGPEWGTQPYTNMFGDWGSTYPSAPAFTTNGLVFKLMGATSIGAVGYAGQPTSSKGAQNIVASSEAVGLKAPFDNTTVQIGTPTFSTIALEIKSSGINGLYPGLSAADDVSLVTAAKQAGARIPYIQLLGGYNNVVGTASQTYLEGTTFTTYYTPPQFNTSATRQVTSILKKYGVLTGNQFYGFNIMGWLGANLAITGLEGAGSHPTAHSVIASLRKVKNYNAGGLLPASISFNHFGSGTSANLGAAGCLDAVKLVGSKFIAFNHGKPVCGTKIP